MGKSQRCCPQESTLLRGFCKERPTVTLEASQIGILSTSFTFPRSNGPVPSHSLSPSAFPSLATK